MTDSAIWWIRNSVELYQNRIPYSPDGTICHISSILHLTASVIFTAFTRYEAVLSPSLLCKYICLASDFSGKFNIHFAWIWARYIVVVFLIGARIKLPLLLVKFLTVQPVNMVNAWTVNGAVPQNSFFTRWHHLSH